MVTRIGNPELLETIEGLKRIYGMDYGSEVDERGERPMNDAEFLRVLEDRSLPKPESRTAITCADAKALIERYYSDTVLDPERARRSPPDRRPLPLTA